MDGAADGDVDDLIEEGSSPVLRAFVAAMPDDGGADPLRAALAEVDRLTGWERHVALTAWARGESWSAALMLCSDEIGRLAREAWAAVKIDAAADTPAKRWWDAPAMAGRASFCRLLGLTDADAGYAAHPLRTLRWDGRDWVAAAIGLPPLFTSDPFPFLDVTDVLLWDPRTGAAAIAGEDRPRVIAPWMPDETVTVYANATAFLRDWMARRARTARLFRQRAAGEWAHPIAQPADGDLPGALVVGDLMAAPVRDIGAHRLAAGPGLTRGELHAALVRSANLPAVVSA